MFDHRGDRRRGSLPGWLPSAGILGVYAVVAAFYTWPLLAQSHSRIANDYYDPILNASILWWNATTIPFSDQWWNPPFFYPSHDVSAFTENLLGIGVFASPVYWLSGNPLAAYNIAFFLTWPLSAFAAYLLVLFLVRRHDAAFLAGLVYGFTPYRTSELGHIQMLSTYWMPLVLLGLHGFLEQRRGRWLVLFGVAWVLQALANGYFILFGAVLIGLWLLYFCSTRDSWRAVPAVILAWGLASLPLVPLMWKYHAVHEHYGMRRTMTEALAFSAQPRAWFEISQVASFWHVMLPEAEDNLFPGLTAVALVLVALLLGLRRGRHASGVVREFRFGRPLRIGLALVTATSVFTILVMLVVGPWRVELAGVVLRMTELDRAVGYAVPCGIALLLLSTRTRDALKRRSPFVFYVAATFVMALLSCGPVLGVGEHVILEPMPYRWLMYLPGFDQLRVPTRFWMLGVLCLATAAGLSFVRLLLARGPLRVVAFSIAASGLLLDGWIRGIGMVVPPRPWPRVERRDQTQPILELPLGPEWDAAATFRSIWHRRRVVNGVSGHDPPHYAPLQDGLNARDPEVLLALATLGSLDVVVNGAADPDGAWARYVSSTSGFAPFSTDGTRTAYRIPAAPREIVLGPTVPIAGVQASANDPRLAWDGRIDTQWEDGPQRSTQWLIVDVGAVREVGGVTHALGEFARDFPRRLTIDVSVDGWTWDQVWEGPTAGPAFLAAVDEPRRAVMRFAFPGQPARFVRLRQIADHKNLWRVAELTVHGPPPR